MSGELAIALGFLFFVVWTIAMIYYDSLRKVHTLGRTDQISKVNKKRDYSGIPLWVYNAGRKSEARLYCTRVRRSGRAHAYRTTD